MLHRFNAQVVALSRTEKDLQSLQEEIGCETIIAELGNPEEARRAAEKAGEYRFPGQQDIGVDSVLDAIWRANVMPDSKFEGLGDTDHD